MQVVIDIDKKIYQHAILLQSQGEGSVYAQIIANGTPIPEGHGRLIDADDIDNHIIGHVDTRSCPTIIEADKSEVN